MIKMSYDVAVASVDGGCIDSHFGQAKTYQIISVDEEGEQWKIIRTVTLDWDDLMQEGEGGCCAHNEKIVEYVAEQLKGCRYVLVGKIGPRPQKLMKRYGLDCLETNLNIDEAVERLIRYDQRFSGERN